MTKDLSKTITFYIFLAVITILFFNTIRVLLSPIFYGVVFAIVLYPIHTKVTHLFRGRAGLSAFLSIIVSALLILGLATTLGVFLFKDATTLFNTIGDSIESLMPQINNMIASLQRILPPTVADQLSNVDLEKQLVASAQNVSKAIFQNLQSIVSNIIGLVAFILVTLYSTFFILRDGEKWSDRIFKILPFPNEEDKFLSDAFVEMTRTALKMVFIIGAIQGFLGGLIFWILGITSPVFWGFIFALASLLPGIGHATIWIPTAVILFLTGNVVPAIILIAYGAIVMGFSDDLLRPYLLSRGAEVNPYIMLLSTLGGVLTFGFTGLILGPIIAVLTLTCWKLYEKKYA